MTARCQSPLYHSRRAATKVTTRTHIHSAARSFTIYFASSSNFIFSSSGCVGWHPTGYRRSHSQTRVHLLGYKPPLSTFAGFIGQHGSTLETSERLNSNLRCRRSRWQRYVRSLDSHIAFHEYIAPYSCSKFPTHTMRRSSRPSS